VTVSIVTDSAAALPEEMARARGITVVPMWITVDDHAVLESDISLHELLAHDHVTTSGPSPGDFDFQWTTPSGRIVLRGAADRAYPAGSYFLEDVYPLAYPDSAGLFISNSLWTRPGMIAGPPLATEKGVGHGCQWP
jgi:hypothetical protein